MKDPSHVLPAAGTHHRVGPGLGAALARRFGREGFELTIAARHQEHLDAIASELRSEGLAVDTLVLDAADPAGTEVRLTSLSERIDPDVVIYNAAVEREQWVGETVYDGSVAEGSAV